MGEIVLECLLQLSGELPTVECRVDYVVDGEAAHVDVRRADRADLGVDADRLRVQVALLVRTCSS
jgi:hypothetical protein